MKTMLKRTKGFTVIELLILVAVLGVVAAVAVPALVQQRIAANESATIGDIRTVISAQAAYQSANGGYYEGALTCMSNKGGCIPSASVDSPTFLDQALAVQAPRSGYARFFVPGQAPVNPEVGVSLSATSKIAYTYLATPLQQGVTGVRGFGGDSTGVLCYTPSGFAPATDANAKLDLASCTILK